ncbi:hypothetical protein Pyn_25824 [Prunus yedoensis var. nudiflora]|uniref:Uncharacterized protein n=1 Tax=Prunus yedoensis var. nudiflora TaxID=2094558 RepID=A0A314YCP9_PRUYE|nr:hypothetical protein Pyn_25824 [Prunus yedoensis var. nudiflora]
MEAREYQTRQIQFIHAPLRDHLCNTLPALTKPRPITFYTTLGSDSKRATSDTGYSNCRPCRFQTSQAPRRSGKKAAVSW